MMHRRQFLQALAASVVAVGAPLPVGFPTLPKKTYTTIELYNYLVEMFEEEENRYPQRLISVKMGENGLVSDWTS